MTLQEWRAAPRRAWEFWAWFERFTRAHGYTDVDSDGLPRCPRGLPADRHIIHADGFTLSGFHFQPARLACVSFEVLADTEVRDRLLIFRGPARFLDTPPSRRPATRQ